MNENNLVEQQETLDENIDEIEIQEEENVYNNEDENTKIHESVKKILQTSKYFMIAGWLLTIIFIGFFIISIACALIGIQFIRKNQIKRGLLMAIFGLLTLGVWPYIAADKYIKNDENIIVDYDNIEFTKSVLKGYNWGLICSIIGIMTMIFLVGFYIVLVAVYLCGVQHIRQQRVVYGTLMIIFGLMTLGTWPLIDCFYHRMKLKKYIKNYEKNLTEELV